MVIVRFDYPTRGLVGFQCRARLVTHTKFFSDRTWGGTESARVAAESYRSDYYREHPEDRTPEVRDIDRAPRASNTSGVPGVGLVTISPKKPGGHAWTYWQALLPGGPTGANPGYFKKFTSSVHGFDRAREMAIKCRAAYVQARDSGTLGEFWASLGGLNDLR